MKCLKVRRGIMPVFIAVMIMVMSGMAGMSDRVGMVTEEKTFTVGAVITDMIAPDIVFASVKSSKAKSIATKDAKARYRISKAYSVKAASKTYRNNAIWKVTFSGRKSGDKYSYIYYVSKSSGKIMYRKQY